MSASQATTAQKHLADDAALAKPLAPEEVRVGDFVAVLHMTYELPSFYWCAESFELPRHEPVRIQFVGDGSSLPLKVRAICLPFVFTKDPKGNLKTLDLRLCRLARLSRPYAKTVWKAHKKDKPVSLLNLL